jgi:hypothetical protein
MDIHRASVELITQELKQIGFGSTLSRSVVDSVLYPHYVGHLIGIGQFFLLRSAILAYSFLDLHESNFLDRDERYVFCYN